MTSVGIRNEYELSNTFASADDLNMMCLKTVNLEIPINICYYNMTVWILAGNYISFTIAAGLIRLHMPGVKKSRV